MKLIRTTHVVSHEGRLVWYLVPSAWLVYGNDVPVMTIIIAVNVSANDLR